jgi:hypothetical protein
MNGILFIIFGIFLILLVYACYPWIQWKIKPFLTKTNTEIVPLDECSQNTIPSEKSWAFIDFFKKFVLYISQPILHGFFETFGI